MADELTKESDTVNLVNPEGSLVSVPVSQHKEALSTGYTEPTEEITERYKYGTTGQQLLTGLEGAGSAATFGLSGAIENAVAKIPGLETLAPENRKLREKTNPGSKITGQLAGIIGSGGAFGALEGAGLGAGKLLGLGAEAEIAAAGERAAATALENGATSSAANIASQAAKSSAAAGFSNTAKIGSKAVKLAAENALFTAGDETSKLLSDDMDPNHPVQTALTDIGLSGLIGAGLGGALGSINPLWKSGMSGKTGSILDAISRKAGGESILPDELNAAIQKTGIDLPPEVKASLSSDPVVKQLFQTLQDSSTSSGLKAQEALKSFKGSLGDHVTGIFGRAPDELESLSELSPNQAGRDIQSTLADELKQKVGPLSEQFEKTKQTYKAVPLSDISKNEIAEEISKMSQEKGYNLAIDLDSTKYVQKVLNDLPNLKTLEDLRKYQSILGEDLSNKQMWDLNKSFRSIFNEAEGNLLEKTIGDKAPDTLANHLAAKTQYAEFANMQDSLNDRLHVGKYGGPGSFIKGLKELEPESFLRRLDPKDDADLLKTLQEQFPNTAQKLKDYQISNLLKTASGKAGEGSNLNYGTLFKTLDSIKSPEYRNFLVDAAAQEKLGAIKSLIKALPEKIGKSGTPQGLDALWSKVPGSAIGIITMLSSHNPVTGFLAGALTKVLSRDAPDAVRLGLLKYLGSAAPLEADGFKSMVDFISHTIKGESLVSKAASNVFKAGMDVLPSHLIPSDKARDKLDSKLKDLQVDQGSLYDVGGKIGHYLPNQGTAVAQTAGNAVQYLNSLRPNVDKKNPLDSDIEVSKPQKATFNNALDIAEQPLLVLKSVKDGTVTPQEIKHLQAMYPALYQRLSDKMQHGMIDEVNKGNNIPYKTRIGLSMFLAQPMDSTLTPQGISLAQSKSLGMKQDQIQSQQTSSSGPHSMKNINKLPNAYLTPSQARIASKSKI